MTAYAGQFAFKPPQTVLIPKRRDVDIPPYIVS